MLFEIQPPKSSQGKESVEDEHTVDVVDEPITYNEFFHTYLLKNKPCIIRNVTENWECKHKWLSQTEVNYDYLMETYGGCEVTVYDCDEKHYNSQKTSKWRFDNYLENCWKNKTEQRLYLKDWHLKNTFPLDNFYQVPLYFASDWLNEYLVAAKRDDYRFVYMGKAGTWTPFHADVFNSYSWSVNLCGSKKWMLFPPGMENNLRDSLNNLPYDLANFDENTTDHLQIIQNAGDAVFIPSGWHHQVWNLEDTISINHNWINGCNLDQMWTAMIKHLDSVKREIQDCKGMEDFVQHCQLMLKSSFGMDFREFYHFLSYICQQRVEFLQGENNGVLFHDHVIGTNHALFDLDAIVRVAEKFVRHVDVPELFYSHTDSPIILLETIKNISLV